ncbi:MAG: GIY-YIG nuclease family protein [Myxococcales bacterium]|nr:GIY-YIG nuclease family protein [Myxococcales bacterium]
MSDWVVYVLVSSATGRTYVGITRDLPRRLSQHNGEIAGGAKATRAGRPWRVGAQRDGFASRAEAQAFEAEVKRHRGGARVDWIRTG